MALNYLCHLSGIASETNRIVRAVAGYNTKIACTRKTTPGQRAFEKYAVRVGGGVNHRFGLDDGILIKDNHIAIAGGIATAVKRAQESVGHMMKVEVEVDTLAQLHEALACKVDAVLLDNMDIDTLEEAVGSSMGGRSPRPLGGSRLRMQLTSPQAALISYQLDGLPTAHPSSISAWIFSKRPLTDTSSKSR